MKTLQFFLTPSAGKALLARGLVRRTDVVQTMKERTLVIVAGTTNTYVAQEALEAIGEEGFGGKGFYRGIVKPPSAKATLPMLEGDVVIRGGVWQRGAAIHDVAAQLGRGDMILKGANAVHLQSGECGVLIGHPAYGTMAPVSQAVLGKGASLIIPVGVEKRVEESIFSLAQRNNLSGGVRLSAMPGRAYTELDAIADMGGVRPCIVAGGGVCGYEGGCYICCDAEPDAAEAIERAVAEAMKAPPYSI